MRSSGVYVVSNTVEVSCFETVWFRGEQIPYGCDWSGRVDVDSDFQTGETFWKCPQCGFEHFGLIREETRR